jgi:hypothetical protein
MKIQNIILGLMLTSPISLVAQNIITKDKIQFGIKLGVNVATLNTKSTTTEESIIGINSGFMIRIPCRPQLAIQPELCFMGNGSLLTYNNDDIIGKVQYNLNYIQLPVLVDYTLNRYLHFQAGPYASFLLTSDVDNSSPSNIFNFEKNITYSDFNTFDFGFIGGTSLHYRDISLGFRYNLGLVKVANDKSILGKQYSFADGTNRVASVYIALIP